MSLKTFFPHGVCFAHTPHAYTDHKKVVEIALNLKAVYSVDDKEHNFTSLVVLHLRFDSSPLTPGGEEWEPEVSILNARDLDELHHVPGHGVQIHAGKGHHPRIKTITKHYEANFIKSLNLRDYPFDTQVLTIVITGDNYSLLTHMMDRDANGNPELVAEDDIGPKHPHRYIKSVMDDDALTEWEVLVWDEYKELSKEFGTMVPVISMYEFKDHEHDFGGDENNNHGRLDFHIYVNRR